MHLYNTQYQLIAHNQCFNNVHVRVQYRWEVEGQQQGMYQFGLLLSVIMFIHCNSWDFIFFRRRCVCTTYTFCLLCQIRLLQMQVCGKSCRPTYRLLALLRCTAWFHIWISSSTRGRQIFHRENRQANTHITHTNLTTNSSTDNSYIWPLQGSAALITSDRYL